MLGPCYEQLTVKFTIVGYKAETCFLLQDGRDTAAAKGSQVIWKHSIRVVSGRLNRAERKVVKKMQTVTAMTFAA